MTMKPITSTPSSSSSAPPPFIFRETLVSPLFLLAFILSIAAFYCTAFTYICPLYYFNHPIPTNHTVSAAGKRREQLPFAIGKAGTGCDVFNGKWVRDYARPPYEEWECPYLEPQTTCLAHGRLERDYRYWKWQPHGCSIPSINVTLMLEALRGKRMMFVGDSLNREQFISLVCLLQRDIPPHTHSMKVSGSLTVFTAKDYNATIEFYWAPFLLESNSDGPFHHRVIDRIIRNGSIDKHGRNWEGADILLFNTYIWWISGLKLLLRGSFGDEAKDIVGIERDHGYRMAMKNLIQWINENIDAKEKRVFFITMSPTHQWSYKWGGDPNGNCYNQTSIIENWRYFAAEKSIMKITVEELSMSRVAVTLLNITQLSSPRKDAHVSIYKKQSRPLTKEDLANPPSYADCIHWCLPGLPDIWNQLLFAKLFYP